MANSLPLTPQVASAITWRLAPQAPLVPLALQVQLELQVPQEQPLLLLPLLLQPLLPVPQALSLMTQLTSMFALLLALGSAAQSQLGKSI